MVSLLFSSQFTTTYSTLPDAEQQNHTIVDIVSVSVWGNHFIDSINQLELRRSQPKSKLMVSTQLYRKLQPAPVLIKNLKVILLNNIRLKTLIGNFNQ